MAATRLQLKNYVTNTVNNLDSNSNDQHNLNMDNTNIAQQDEESIDSNITTDRETSLQVTSWVKTNYVREREHNVPRKNMFEHYKTYCIKNNLTPVNSATFGKLLRAVFPDLKTRRLGVRGQSKYHYCGIRVRDPNEQYFDENTFNESSNPVNTNNNELPLVNIINEVQYNRSNTMTSVATTTSGGSRESIRVSTINPNELPTFNPPEISPFKYTDGIDFNMISTFTLLYERHCNDIFRFISAHQIDSIKNIMISFYAELSFSHIKMIRALPEIIEAIWRWDCSLYDTIINKFLPTVNHSLPQDTIYSLRTYTRELRSYIESALPNYPVSLIQKKLDVARIFSAKFRRQLSLNFAAQTASAILNEPHHLSHMQQDWHNFDFDSILDQTLWVCDCDTNEIRHILYREVYELLTSKAAIEYWMDWVNHIVNKYLKIFAPNTPNEANCYLNKSKQLLLKWNFYTSLIMKDLTLQQARSFGSFQSLRLFLDDYMLYLVEENIAQVNFSLMQFSQQVNLSQQRPYQRSKGKQTQYHPSTPKDDSSNYFTRTPSSITADTNVGTSPTTSIAMQNTTSSTTDVYGQPFQNDPK